jgi:hypothetical protein
MSTTAAASLVKLALAVVVSFETGRMQQNKKEFVEQGKRATSMRLVTAFLQLLQSWIALRGTFA